ncbi:hypothetical protein FZEAL_9410 [Fusarium zealandicum]|uniref:Uncharacterized protein n=1 Tax=Fusarium zealandicum TaxID=1053134 RepID=A0A8H4UBP7_9HYPO|nr:hypothetical protein FZEAL_9410 [Fusarium zealandicum]
MSARMPLFTSANGIHSLVINESRQIGDGPAEIRSKEENTWTFTSLASAINIGIDILETHEGRTALAELADMVIENWRTNHRHWFPGDDKQLPRYVDHFLSALRRDFPQVTVEHLGGPDVLASTKRMVPLPGLTWDGDLLDYRPKDATGLYYNHSRVADMVAAAATMWKNVTGSRRPSEEAQRMAKRHKEFQFMFAVATAHELCHAFVGYLAQNDPQLTSYTPPEVTYLDYSAPRERQSTRNGESGRWLENRLFGGSIEFYHDPQDTKGQVGIPYLLKRDAVAFRIRGQFMRRMVETSREFKFPFPTLGRGVTVDERARLQMQSVGSNSSKNEGRLPPAGILYMRPRRVGPVLAYNVSSEELQRVPISPRPLRAQRVSG